MLPFLFSACSSGLKLAANQTGSTHEVSVGDFIDIELSSNPSTGYQWKLDGTLTTGPVRLISNNFKASPSSEGMVGVGGTEYWRFQAVESGTADVKLLYKREFEQEAVNTVTYKINVK